METCVTKYKPIHFCQSEICIYRVQTDIYDINSKNLASQNLKSRSRGLLLCVLWLFSAGSCCSSELWRSWTHSNPCCSRQLPSSQLCCTATRPCAGSESQPPTQSHCLCTQPAAVPETQGKTANGASGYLPTDLHDGAKRNIAWSLFSLKLFSFHSLGFCWLSEVELFFSRSLFTLKTCVVRSFSV